MKLRPIHLLFFGGITLILCAGKMEPENPAAQERGGDQVFQCTAPVEIIGEIPIPPPGSVVTVTTFANAINSAGQVVGYQRDEIDDGATITESNKAYVSDDSESLDFFVDNDNSYATGIDGSIVVGHLVDNRLVGYRVRAYYYDMNSSDEPNDVVYLDDDPTTYHYIVHDVNYEEGQDTLTIVGFRLGSPTQGYDQPFIYTSNTNGSEIIDIESGYFSGKVTAINNQNIIVGDLFKLDDLYTFNHAIVYNQNRTPSLINLGELSYVQDRSYAYDINDQNVVVGKTEISNTNEMRAFWFDINAPLHSAQMEVMDCITDTTGTLCPVEALAINNTGFIVGKGSYNPEPRWGNEVFLYDKNNDALFNLNDLIDDASWHLEEATDINDNGWIVGNGTRNGQGRAFKMHCGYETTTYLPTVLKHFWNAMLR